jgi:hypothetical protein
LPEKCSGSVVNAYIIKDTVKVELGHWDFLGTDSNKNLKGPVLSAVIPQWTNGLFKLIIEDADQPAFNSEYKLLIKN